VLRYPLQNIHLPQKAMIQAGLAVAPLDLFTALIGGQACNTCYHTISSHLIHYLTTNK
jgi:hypothetical protein